MSRLTGTDALGLFEAYQTIYSPQELTEEQVWEEVENWVNSLLEEGYDLSDYTWEEMYESYIEEQGGVSPSVARLRAGGPGRSEAPKPAPSMSYTQRMQMRREVRNRGSSSSSTPKPAPKPQFGTTTPKGSSVTSTGVSGLSAADRAAYSAGGGNAAAQRGMGSTTAQVIDQGKKNLGRMDQGKPAPAGAKPTSGGSSTNPKSGLSAYSATKPAAKPAPSPAAKPSAAPAKATVSSAPAKSSNALASATAAASKPPAFNPASTAEKKPSLSSGVADIQRMRAASMMRQQNRNLPSGKIPVGSDLKAHFDLFDVVIGHLLDEGYADTEESALAIMANMSEEWRQSIVESKNA